MVRRSQVNFLQLGNAPDGLADYYTHREYGWFVLSDHSDVLFGPNKVLRPNGYLSELINATGWQTYIDEIATVDSSHDMLRVVPGLELTVGDGTDWETEGHFLALGPASYIDPFTSKPADPSMATSAVRRSAIDLVDTFYTSGGEFGIMAHPTNPYPWNEEYFHVLDKYSGRIGLVVSGLSGPQPRQTLALWDQKLAQGYRVTGVGGSDNHWYNKGLVSGSHSADGRRR